MLAVVTLSLALQVSVRVDTKTREDSLRQRQSDSVALVIQEAIRNSPRDRRPVRRDSVTPELERTAFLDAGARDLLLRARAARMAQDSSLQSYEAKTYQRISIGLGIRAIGRDRLLARTEVASRVRWSRQGGALVEITGERAVAPAFGGDADFEPQMTTPVPYYPGREALWIGGDGLARAEVDDRELIHPIATGSEAYYRYSTGDSLIFTLPDGARITLRELRVEPRRPEWRLSVGSFWFDVATGQLVRAVYRFSAPMDIWAVAREESQRSKQDPSRSGGLNELRELKEEEDDIPGWVRGMMSPLKANLEAVTIEYGLFGGRYWLPRTQAAIANAQAAFLRVPVRIEESFSYNSVNGPETMPVLPPPPRSIYDSLFANDTTPRRELPREERRARNRAVARAAGEIAERRERKRQEECAATGSYTRDWDRYDGALRMAVQVPCDSMALRQSPDLPHSIYDPGEELFGVSERDELLKSLDFSLQSGWAPQPIIWSYGLSQTRYNRVEGFSTGIGGTTELGRGYSLDGALRLGTGDWSPNAELGGSRSNGRTTWRLGGYRRLSVANDWGAPLSFGAGLGALLFGRDDGFYYRSAGIDLTRTITSGGLTTRFFAEHQSEAEVTTSFSLAHAMGNSDFGENIVATRGNVAGIAIRDVRSAGLDPQGWRAFSDVRLEGGYFDPSADSLQADPYARAAIDLTISRGFGARTAAALTLGAGIADKAPPQRLFLLGGTETVRGQRPGTQSGDSYWLTRFELGRGIAAARGVVFGDLGWAGPRDLWSHPGRPMSGAGVGVSFMDGLVRADLARGIYPSKRFRFDMYVEARF